MGFLTQHGFLWGSVPATTGRVVWVAPGSTYTIAGLSYSSSDDSDGLSPERALRTVAKAWTKVTANSGDLIILLPGAHTVTAVVTANIAGVTMMGLPRYSGSIARPITSITTSAAADIMTVSATNIEVAWLHFIPVTTMDAISEGGASGFHIHHCSFDMYTAAASTSTQGINCTTANVNLNWYIHDCVFYCDDAQGEAIDFGLTGNAGGGASLLEKCTFIQSAGTWAAAVRSGPTSDSRRGLLIRECDFMVSNGTLTAGIIGSAGNSEESVHIHRCYFSDSVTVGIDTYGARGAEIAENYQSGVGSTDGGVLITAIT
jgi:hypothetical protein